MWTDGLGFAPGLAVSPVDGGRIALGGSEAAAAGTVAFVLLVLAQRLIGDAVRMEP